MTIVNTTKDSYVRSVTPDGNFGSQLAIIVDSDVVAEALVEFNISGITNVSTATLNLFLTGADSGSENYTAKRITDDTWTEGGVTWNNKPSSTTTNQSTISIPAVVTTYYSWNVKSMVQDALDLGKTVIGFYIVGSGGRERDFASREYPPNQPPYLEYTVTSDVYVNSSTGNDSNVGDSCTAGHPFLTFGKAYSNVNTGGTIHVCNSGADFSSETVTLNKSFSIDLNGSSGNFYGPKAS